jgi:hypothetical protein
MKETITAKELEEAMNAILKQARKMEKSDDVQEHFYGFGMEGAMTSLAIYLNA